MRSRLVARLLSSRAMVPTGKGPVRLGRKMLGGEDVLRCGEEDALGCGGGDEVS
jgi:hypothetical protein